MKVEYSSTKLMSKTTVDYLKSRQRSIITFNCCVPNIMPHLHHHDASAMTLNLLVTVMFLNYIKRHVKSPQEPSRKIC